MSDAVLTEEDGGVLVITINRPEAKNAVNGDVAKGVKSFKSGLKDDDPPRPLPSEQPVVGEPVKKDEHASG